MAEVTREELAEALRGWLNKQLWFYRNYEMNRTSCRYCSASTYIDNDPSVLPHNPSCPVVATNALLSRLDAEQNAVTRLPHWWPVQPPEYEGEEGRTIDNVIECWDHTGDAEESYRPLAEWAVKIGFRPILDAEQNGGRE